MAKIAIVGVGAIGGALAAFLGSTGKHELVLCTRRPLGKLTLQTPDGEISVQGTNLTDPDQAKPVDWLIVAAKAYDTESIARWLKPLTSETTPVAVAQNGVEHKERFRPWVPEERLLPVVVQVSVNRLDNGDLSQGRKAKLTVEDSPRGREFAGLFSGSPVRVELTADMKSALWRKLCTNSTGSLSVLVGRPFGEFRNEELADLALAMTKECVAVARAEGAALDDSAAHSVVQEIFAGDALRNNSMLSDRLAGKPLEWDARNGVIVRLGKKHGIPTPLNSLAVFLLKELGRS